MSENEWELSKENVLPLKQGRTISNLAAGLQPSADQMTLLKQQRMEFETELRLYDGPDPLDPWYRYIHWTEQTFPRGGKGSHLSELLQRCVTAYKDDDRYKNDVRYLTIWIKFANICKDAIDIYSFLFNHKIGYKLASFYEAWASELERIDNNKRADIIYMQGIKNEAEPIELLKQKYSEFQARLTRRILGEVVLPPEPVTSVEDPKRMALGKLQGRGSKAKVGTDRSSATAEGGFHLPEGPRQSNVSQPGFKIVNDEIVNPGTLPQPTGEWADIRGAITDKENTQTPGVWTKAKMKQKHKPVVKIGEISSVVKPEFSVHTDEDQAMVTPRKANPQIHTVLSSKKPEKNNDPFYHVQHNLLNQADQMPMYCKHKIYAGGLEFQFEELRAARWMEKFKRKEDIRIKEELEKQREDLRQQQEEMVKHQHEMQLLLERQQRDQEQALAQQKKLMFEEFQKQMEKERLLVREQISTMKIQETNKPTVDKENKSDLGSMETSLVTNVMDSTAGLLACNIGDVTPAINPSSITPNTASFSLNQTGIGCGVDSASFSLNQTGIGCGVDSASFSLNQTGIGRGPTPNTSSLKSTPSSGCKLTAPSPTINTKKAISTINCMFNETMDLQEMLGWGKKKGSYALQEDMQFANNKTEQVPAIVIAPFTIFDENAEASIQPPVPTPITVFEDKENSVPATKSDRRGLAAMDSSKTEMLSSNAQSSQSVRSDVSVKEARPATRSQFSEDVDMTEDQILTSGNKDSWREYMMDDMISEMSFNPDFSSTCTFSKLPEAARLASTPYNPAGDAVPFPDPSVSHIKPQSNESNNQENTLFTGRKSTQADLSTIIECSDEDVKYQASSLGPNSMAYSSHTSTSSQSSMASNSTSSLSSQTPGVPRMAEMLNTINEEASYRHDTKEDLGNVTCHEINLMDYMPPKPDAHMQHMLDMSVAIDPNDPFEDDLIENFLSELPKPLSDYPNYHNICEIMPDIIPGEEVKLGDHVYTIKNRLGKGAFAQVFKVQRKHGNRKFKEEVLKNQKPPCPWEYYISVVLQERLKKLCLTYNLTNSMMSINAGYFFVDGSCMTSTLHSYGTLLNVVNMMRKNHQKFPAVLQMIFILDLITLVEIEHQCHIIHGDIKPDNLLITKMPVMTGNDLEHFIKHRALSIKLIDFGRSIDMTMFPEGRTFTALIETENFQCIEMKTNRPWTYQTDMFGLIGTIHVLLFGHYMNVFQCQGKWKTTSSFKRGVVAGELLEQMFTDLLNIPSCDQLPSLARYRQSLEEYFVKNNNAERVAYTLQYFQEQLDFEH